MQELISWGNEDPMIDVIFAKKKFIYTSYNIDIT